MAGYISVRRRFPVVTLASRIDFGADFQEAEKVYQQGNHQKAVRLFMDLAEKGDFRAQRKLGLLYSNALGVERDYSKAFGWYRKAAEQVDAQSLYFVGLFYELGRGVPIDKFSFCPLVP